MGLTAPHTPEAFFVPRDFLNIIQLCWLRFDTFWYNKKSNIDSKLGDLLVVLVLFIFNGSKREQQVDVENLFTVCTIFVWKITPVGVYVQLSVNFIQKSFTLRLLKSVYQFSLKNFPFCNLLRFLSSFFKNPFILVILELSIIFFEKIPSFCVFVQLAINCFLK